MIKNIIFDDEIVVHWEKQTFLKEKYLYRLKLNENVYFTEKTHFRFKSLIPCTEYKIQLAVVDENKREIYTIDNQTIKTREKKAVVDISKPPYNLKGDGVTLSTEVIQKAFNECGPNQIIYFPAGIYLTGALNLHSNMEIYLCKGAILQGTENLEDYLPKRKSRFEGIEMMCYSSLLNMGELDHASGCNCENIIIRGEGTVSGGGDALRKNIIELETILLKDYMESLGEAIAECEKADTIPGRARPRLINISNTDNVVISGITIQNGPAWNVHMIYSQNIVTYGCKFFSMGINNGDGWDPDSSENCTIFDCDFYTGDDAVAIKSGKNPEGNIINKPCKHIRIFDCRIHSGCGIAMGSEMSGGIEDVIIWDCDMEKSLYGIEVKGTKKRGGYVRNIKAYNCTLPRIMIHEVDYNNDGESSGEMPCFEDYYFQDIIIKRNLDIPYLYKLIEFCGFDDEEHSIKNVVLKNIKLYAKSIDEAISMNFTKNITKENFTFCK